MTWFYNIMYIPGFYKNLRLLPHVTMQNFLFETQFKVCGLKFPGKFALFFLLLLFQRNCCCIFSNLFLVRNYYPAFFKRFFRFFLKLNFVCLLRHFSHFKQIRIAKIVYRKVSSSNTSHLGKHAGFFKLLMKGIFDPYVL